MTRFVPVGGLVAAALLVAAPAHANLPNGAVINFERLLIVEDGQLREPTNPDVLRQYLNLAHCGCSQANAGDETALTYELRLSAETNSGRPVEIWVGTQCDNDMLRPQQCKQITTVGDIDDMFVAPARVEIPLYELINVNQTGSCRIEEGTATIWVMVDTDGAPPYDYVVTQSAGQWMGMGEVSRFDTRAPELPTDFEAASAEGAIRLRWTQPMTRAEDLFWFQALCAGPDGAPLGKSEIPRYETPRTLCGSNTDITLVPSEIIGGGAPTTLPAGMAQLDPAYLCATSDAPTSTELLIDGLENEVPYTVALLAIDRYGNPVGTYFTTTITPRPATDLWEDLHDRGSRVEGGFCLVSATTGGGTPPALVSLLLVALAGAAALRAPRRRRLPAAAALALLAGAAALPAPARAQGLTPYWEEEAAADDPTAPDDVTWHAGLRLGPYTPGIDAQFQANGGTGEPYREMFGRYIILPMLDVDRILWRGFGHLGIGGSIGYRTDSAQAWADGSAPGPGRMRSDGDETTFGVLPMALTAVYRFTYLDDRFGIPVVPYVRGGLAYTVWWMRTNGKTSEVCWDGTRDPDCDADAAVGGSIGVTGAVGIAIRAERIDAAAATSMRAGGIQHAGFYAEINAAKVDGFGSEFKLAVGDTTWFAGVDFEF